MTKLKLHSERMATLSRQAVVERQRHIAANQKAAASLLASLREKLKDTKHTYKQRVILVENY
jgi:hypothetical protein